MQGTKSPASTSRSVRGTPRSREAVGKPCRASRRKRRRVTASQSQAGATDDGACPRAARGKWSTSSAGANSVCDASARGMADGGTSSTPSLPTRPGCSRAIRSRKLLPPSGKRASESASNLGHISSIRASTSAGGSWLIQRTILIASFRRNGGKSTAARNALPTWSLKRSSRSSRSSRPWSTSGAGARSLASSTRSRLTFRKARRHHDMSFCPSPPSRLSSRTISARCVFSSTRSKSGKSRRTGRSDRSRSAIAAE
ncbi:hypothetical protein DFJ74DRAFT_666468 [Hyaloraphidium curvatum]|nr:hypothetical protein DFJ74DRAFT_666468 [Hyaloraphidium curvatum]